MKKIFLLLACFICLKASAQINAVNDTTRITASPTFSPQFIPNIFNSGGVNYRVTYVYNPSTQKYDAVVYSKYLRAFYLAKTDALGSYIQNQNLIDQIANERLRGTITINKPLFHGVIPHSFMNGDGFTASRLNSDSTVNVSITGTANQLLINEGAQQVFGLQGNASGNHISSGAVVTTFDDTVRSARVPVNDLDVANKLYVDSHSSSYTFNNGLTNSGGTVGLGGTLSSNTLINQGAHSLEINGTNTGQSIDVLFDNTSGGATVYLATDKNNPSGVGRASLNMQSGGGVDSKIQLRVVDATDNSKVKGFNFTNNTSAPILITDDVSHHAVDMANNYDLDDLSLPTKHQVDSLISGGGFGTGTVTSITPGIGFTLHTPITNSGTMDVDTAHIRGGLLKSSDAATTYLQKASPTYTSTLNGPRQNVGDTTRNSLIYALGTSITRGVGSSNVTQYDSTYLSKLGRAMGFRWTNRGLSGRFLEQPGAVDSSGYSQRYSIPAPTSVKDIYEIELQVNDGYHDSTIYTPATYRIQLDSMVVAAHSKGWAYNKIWIHNTGYYNPVASNPTSPNTEYRHSLFMAQDVAEAAARGTLQSDNYAAMKTAWLADATLYDSNVLHPTNKGHTMIHVLDSTYLASVGITKVIFATNIQNVIGSQYVYGDVNGQQNLNARNDANISNNANITNDAIIGRNITIAGTGSIGTTLAVGTIATVTTRVSTPSVQNITTGNNSTVNLTDNGVVLLRNVADATAAVTSQNSNSSSTGSIHVFKFGSTTKATISKDGYIGIGTTAPTAKIQLFGTATLNPWGSALAQNLLISANTITDNTTADASTITTANINYFGIPTINAANSSTGITYTTANNVVIAGAPTITGTNAVATNAYALNVLAGGTRLGALTASQAVFTDANKQLVSNAITGSGSVVMSTSPTLTTPNLGTPSTLIATNATGTASGLTAGNVTTNANLTGPVTSVGNATTVTAASITNAMLAGSIDLTAKVTAILPIANGGTGSATQNFVDLTTNQTKTGVLTLQQNALGTSTTDAGVLSNTTAAAVGAQQISPSLHFSSNGWGTTAGTSQDVSYRINVLPVQAATPTGTLQFQASINGGAYANAFTATSGGLIATSSSMQAGGSFMLNHSSIAVTSTDGLFLANNTASLVGTQAQWSPRSRWTGSAWNTTSTASNTMDAIAELQTSGGAVPSSKLAFGFQNIAAGGYTYPFSIDNSGNINPLSVNKVTITAPATSATLTIANGKTLTANNSITIAGTDATTMTFPTTSATIARTDAANTFTGVQTMTSPALTTPKLTGYTVATLPAGTVGMIAYVTDALTPTFGNVLVGGGAVVAKAFYNGTNWINE